jgi:hypothetical protein
MRNRSARFGFSTFWVWPRNTIGSPASRRSSIPASAVRSVPPRRALKPSAAINGATYAARTSTVRASTIAAMPMVEPTSPRRLPKTAVSSRPMMRKIAPSSTSSIVCQFCVASVGLTIAPKAIPAAIPSPGTTAASTSPTTVVDSNTSSTDRPPIAPNSRRKSMAGMATADEKSNGGNTPARIHSGSISTGGIPGSTLTPTPISTSSNGAATPIRSDSMLAAAIPNSPRTPTIKNSTQTPSGRDRSARAACRYPSVASALRSVSDESATCRESEGHGRGFRKRHPDGRVSPLA